MAAATATTLRLRADQLAKLRTLTGLTTDAKLAHAMAIDPATVYRVLRGQAAPGTRFMTALVSAFPGMTLDDFFEVVPTDDTDAGAA